MSVKKLKLCALILGLVLIFVVYDKTKHVFRPPFGTRSPLRWVHSRIAVSKAVLEGEPLIVTMTLMNDSRELRIVNLKSTCACAKITSEYQRIDPTGRWTVYPQDCPFTAEFNTSGRRGPQRFTVTASGDPIFPGEPAACVIDAIVTPYLVCDPARVTLVGDALKASNEPIAHVVEVLAGAPEVGDGEWVITSPKGVNVQFIKSPAEKRTFDGAPMMLRGKLAIRFAQVEDSLETVIPVKIECAKTKRHADVDLFVMPKRPDFEMSPSRIATKRSLLPSKRVVLVRVKSASKLDELRIDEKPGVVRQVARMGTDIWKLDFSITEEAFTEAPDIVIKVALKDKNIGADLSLSVN